MASPLKGIRVWLCFQRLVKLFGEDTPKLSVLTVNQMHNLEHYGNLITYMRMKKIVPPTSEPGVVPEAKK